MNTMTRRQMIQTGGKAAGIGVAGLFIAGSMQGCNPSTWIDIALADLPTANKMVISILSFIQGSGMSAAEIAKINTISDDITTELNLAKTLVVEYQVSANATLLTKIDAVLVLAENNFNAILAGLHITDAVLAATVSAAIGVAITVIVAVQAAVPPPPAATAARKSLQKNAGANAAAAAFNLVVHANYPGKEI